MGATATSDTTTSGFYTDPSNYLPGTPNAQAGANISTFMPSAPNIDPRYQELENEQNQLAGNYAGNLQQNQNDLANQSLASIKQQLGDTIKGVKANTNASGLLYSGMNTGGQLAARQNAGLQGAQAVEGANQTGLNNLNSLQQNAINTGFGIAGQGNPSAQMGLSSQGNAIQNALNNSAVNTSFVNSLGQGVGSAAGGLIGSGAFSPGTYNPYAINAAQGWGAAPASGAVAGMYAGLPEPGEGGEGA
jgi:hypothetical protein